MSTYGRFETMANVSADSKISFKGELAESTSYITTVQSKEPIPVHEPREEIGLSDPLGKLILGGVILVAAGFAFVVERRAKKQ